MARTELDRAVRPSLLDRLTDDEPRVSADRSTTREESARAYRLSVQRDVEWLLNTRRSIVPVLASQPQVRNSVHEYGVPDTTGVAIGTSAGQRQLTEDIRDAIERFEPRLTNVRIVLVASSQVQAPQVRFSIEATLRMDPSPEQVVFDTVLEISSGTYDVADRV